MTIPFGFLYMGMFTPTLLLLMYTLVPILPLFDEKKEHVRTNLFGVWIGLVLSFYAAFDIFATRMELTVLYEPCVITNYTLRAEQSRVRDYPITSLSFETVDKIYNGTTAISDASHRFNDTVHFDEYFKPGSMFLCKLAWNRMTIIRGISLTHYDHTKPSNMYFFASNHQIQNVFTDNSFDFISFVALMSFVIFFSKYSYELGRFRDLQMLNRK